MTSQLEIDAASGNIRSRHVIDMVARRRLSRVEPHALIEIGFMPIILIRLRTFACAMFAFRDNSALEATYQYRIRRGHRIRLHLSTECFHPRL